MGVSRPLDGFRRLRGSAGYLRSEGLEAAVHCALALDGLGQAVAHLTRARSRRSA